MKDKIIEHLNDPEQLEHLYRSDKKEFEKSLIQVSVEQDSDLVRFWKIRLTPEIESINKILFSIDLVIALILSLVTGLLVKIPQFFLLDENTFYSKYLSLIVFNSLIVYYFWSNKILNKKFIFTYSFTIIVIFLYLFFLPNSQSDSINLIYIHLPLFLWCVFGLSYISFEFSNENKKMDFIRFNGELLIMIGLLIICGLLLSGITFQLFAAINVNINEFFIKYVVIFGSTASPFISIFLIRHYPNITSRISPVIARIFSPLVLITLTIYLITFLFSGNSIIENRDILFIFNIMLLVVVAIILFSISELEKSKSKNINVLILILLALVALIINLLVLYSIIARLTEGFTPNRTVVLVSNILIFVNLILLAKNLIYSYFNHKMLSSVEVVTAKYLSVYFFWTIIVIFILPFIFGI